MRIVMGKLQASFPVKVLFWVHNHAVWMLTIPKINPKTYLNGKNQKNPILGNAMVSSPNGRCNSNVKMCQYQF